MILEGIDKFERHILLSFLVRLVFLDFNLVKLNKLINSLLYMHYTN
ncbi:unnamed protein product [Paramecium sonneborni]|uniref:Uncharacterized protein n=1 Tax=Paramecium sonneborni TaxID=65129 RepID=A0A8S1NW28_9CILI|nr:unnamed protein product [Paramecium sonneborni]